MRATGVQHYFVVDWRCAEDGKHLGAYDRAVGVTQQRYTVLKRSQTDLSYAKTGRERERKENPKLFSRNWFHCHARSTPSYYAIEKGPRCHVATLGSWTVLRNNNDNTNNNNQNSIEVFEERQTNQMCETVDGQDDTNSTERGKMYTVRRRTR